MREAVWTKWFCTLIVVVVPGTYTYDKLTKNCTHGTDVSFLDLILTNSDIKWKHWGNLDEGYKECLFTIII